MKKDSKSCRNNPLFLRNEFDFVGEEEFARIKKQQIDLTDINLLPYSDTRSNESEHYKNMVFISLSMIIDLKGFIVIPNVL